MFKKLLFIALTAASFTACDFLNKKPTASADTSTTESLPPSITDTSSIAENEVTKAVSDKEVAAANKKTAAESAATAASAKKAAAKKAADEAAS